MTLGTNTGEEQPRGALEIECTVLCESSSAPCPWVRRVCVCRNCPRQGARFRDGWLRRERRLRASVRRKGSRRSPPRSRLFTRSPRKASARIRSLSTAFRSQISPQHGDGSSRPLELARPKERSEWGAFAKPLPEARPQQNCVCRVKEYCLKPTKPMRTKPILRTQST